MILLFAALLCLCATGLSEAPISEPAVSEDLVSEGPVSEPAVSETPVLEPPISESPVHDESHSTAERVGASYAEKTGSLETHAWITEYDLYCEDCGQVIQKNVRKEETPQPHDWRVTQEEPTCTEPGCAMRHCAVCGEEDVIETPAVGHCYMWMDMKQPNGEIESQFVCTVCGYVAETRDKSSAQINYNSTITSFGPTVRELVGGGVWNRVTPLNLEEEGMFTYPLIAGNQYTVGTATVINEEGVQVISYKLNADGITVHTQTLVIYPSLEALRTGENALVVEFNQPVEIEQYFGDDQLVLMAITLKADFDPQEAGIQSFREDTALTNALSQLID